MRVRSSDLAANDRRARRAGRVDYGAYICPLVADVSVHAFEAELPQ
jgi:hypothetical protein